MRTACYSLLITWKGQWLELLGQEKRCIGKAYENWEAIAEDDCLGMSALCTGFVGVGGWVWVGYRGGGGRGHGQDWEIPRWYYSDLEGDIALVTYILAWRGGKRSGKFRASPPDPKLKSAKGRHSREAEIPLSFCSHHTSGTFTGPVAELVLSAKTATSLKSPAGNHYHLNPQAQGLVNKASGK